MDLQLKKVFSCTCCKSILEKYIRTCENHLGNYIDGIDAIVYVFIFCIMLLNFDQCERVHPNLFILLKKKKKLISTFTNR